MRVTSDGCGAREPGRREGGFGDTLARATGVDAERRSVAAIVRGVHGCAVARCGPGRVDRLASSNAAGPTPEPTRTELVPDPTPVPELAAVARTLPLAIVAARVAEGPLALSFGRSLEVELRSTAAGVELVLRPDASLARAAAAELPRIVATLRVRGVAVARAEVRPRPAAAGRRVDGRGRLR